VKCKNPFCDYDTERRLSDAGLLKGWCPTCYRLVYRNGTLPMNADVPAFSQKSVTYPMFIEGAVEYAYPMDEFLWRYKVSLDKLVEFEEENKVNYEETRKNGHIVFIK